jgi:hypothetical protein
MKAIPKSSQIFADEMLSRLKDEIKMVAAQREEILQAFVVKYGYEPDNIRQLVGKTDNGNPFWQVVHVSNHELERVKNIYLMSLVSQEPLTLWQKVCLWLAGVRFK